MSELRNRPIRKFNPGTLQSDTEVIEQFVVRKHELDIVLDVLRGNVASSSCQHILVVAPRGRGKTMLLARVAAELPADDELSRRLLPVRFMEESQEIFNLTDFWLETLFHLARESATHDPEFARTLRETHAALTGRWREQGLEGLARIAVLEAADRLGRKLVLMVENLQALCENVDDDFGWKLRGTLQSEPQIILLATATSRFEGLDDATQPFFELFRIIGLEPLATDECRRLWQMVSGDTVSGREIRPLQILTGGNPRLLVIIAGFAQHRSLRQLMEELVKLIDEHTEYFRSHLDVLGKTERRVYIAVIDLWRASNSGEIAARARMDVRIVSTMLGRLVNRGVVLVEGHGKKRLYAAERLYSIYYKLRRERDEAAVVRNLIHFMAMFYSEAELAEMSGMLMAEAAQSQVIREGIDRATAELPNVGNFFSSMAWLGLEQPSNQLTAIDNKNVERRLQEIFAAFKEDAFEKVIEIVNRTFASDCAGSSQVPGLQVAQAFLVKALAHNKLNDFDAAIVAFDEVIARFGGRDEPEIQVVVASALGDKGVARGQLGDFDAAFATFDEVIARFGGRDEPEIQVVVASALGNKGVARKKQGDFDAAIAAYDEVVARLGASDVPEIQVVVASALSNKGRVRSEQGDFDAAIAAYDEVVARFGASDVPEMQILIARALGNKGGARSELGDFDAAIEAYDEVVARFGASEVPEMQALIAMALGSKGVARGELGDHGAAITACDEVVARFGASDVPEMQALIARALGNKGVAQRYLGNFDAAIATYDEVIVRFGGSEVPEIQVVVASALGDIGVARGELGDHGAAITACDEVIARFGDSEVPEMQVSVAMALLNKGVARAQLGSSEQAIATWDEMVERFGTSKSQKIQELIAQALSGKGMSQTKIGCAEEALHTCEELERRIGTLTSNEAIRLACSAIHVRAMALLVQGRHQAAMDEFRSAYAVFDPGNPTMVQGMIRVSLQLLPDLIAAGVSERDLVEILSSDKAKSNTLLPLVVALRQRSGEVVREPAEVLEVAKDIRARIKVKTTKETS